VKCPCCDTPLILIETLPAAKTTRRRYTCSCGFTAYSREVLTMNRKRRLAYEREYRLRLKRDNPVEYTERLRRHSLRRAAREEATEKGISPEEIYIKWGVPTQERGRK